MFDRPRVFADPFGSFLQGRRQAEQDEIAFQNFRSRQRRESLENEALQFRTALDRELAADERRSALETRQLANQSASLDLSLDQRFSAIDRIQDIDLGDANLASLQINNNLNSLRTDALEFDNSLDRLFGTEERATDLAIADAGLRNANTRADQSDFNLSLDRQFGASERRADIDATLGLGVQRRQPRSSANTISPTTQALLNSITGTSPPAAPSPSRQNTFLSDLDQTIAAGGSLTGSQTSELVRLYNEAVGQNPALESQIARNYPNITAIVAGAGR